ncbi:MAG: FAD binding domain-containing protein [Acidimicrobiia bacterium]|nr:FAD binding domain-containing protein [Acidimicrobiia bacterium]
MKPAPFTYHDPTSVGELVSLLGTIEDAKLLAGGQSLMPMLNLRLAQPDHLIDLNTVAGLSGIEATSSGVRVGAMVRQASLMKSAELAKDMPVLAEALHWVGHFQTRTRGTIGGSLSHLDPAAELPAVALLYDAALTVNGPDGSRIVPIREWPIAYMIPNLAEDEVLTSIEFSSWGESHGHAFEEFARRYGDFAMVAVGALLAVRDGVITRAAVSLAGTQPTPMRLDEVEAALIGQPAAPDSFRAAAEMAKKMEAMSDSYTSSRYRQRLAGVLVERALAKAAIRANSGGE